jgi:hypothetical protein
MNSPAFVFFDIGLTLLSPRGAAAYQEVLRELGFQVQIGDIERAFHLEDKRFMRSSRGLRQSAVLAHAVVPGKVNYRPGCTDLCAAAARLARAPAGRAYWCRSEARECSPSCAAGDSGWG